MSAGTAFDGIAEELLSSKGLSPWLVLLTECVIAYRRSEFNVPVPALLLYSRGLRSQISCPPFNGMAIRHVLMCVQ